MRPCTSQVIGARELQKVLGELLPAATRSDPHRRLRMAYARKAGETDLEVLYYLSLGKGCPDLLLRVTPGQHALPSLANQFPALSWYEREMHDLFGIEFAGHPELQPLILHEGVTTSRPPLIGQVGAPIHYRTSPPTVPTMNATEIQCLPFGPVRADIVESAQFLFYYIGEGILHFHQRLFYKHRGMEKRFEGVSPMAGIILAERVSGTDSVAHALAFCQACEMALGLLPPPRALGIRTILAELERLANHLHYFAELARMTTLRVAAAQGAWLEEQVRQINGALTGSRFLPGFLGVGGLRRDLEPSGLASRLTDLEPGISDFLDKLADTRSYLDRLIGTGRLSTDVAMDQGATGPVERASGLDRDLRRDRPYGSYGMLEFRVPQESEGDALARAQVRRAEVTESLALVRESLARLESGPITTDQPDEGPDPAGEGLGAVEGTRGGLYYAVHFDPDGKCLLRVKIKEPSFSNWRVFPFTVKDTNLMDYAINEASFGLSIAGADR